MQNPKVAHTNEISIKVGLDENKVPIDILWTADKNDGTAEHQTCKAILLSLFTPISPEKAIKGVKLSKKTWLRRPSVTV